MHKIDIILELEGKHFYSRHYNRSLYFNGGKIYDYETEELLYDIKTRPGSISLYNLKIIYEEYFMYN